MSSGCLLFVITNYFKDTLHDFQCLQDSLGYIKEQVSLIRIIILSGILEAPITFNCIIQSISCIEVSSASLMYIFAIKDL